MGVDNDILERLKKYVVAGKIDLNTLSNGSEVVVCRQADESDFKYDVGDTIKLANVLNTNPDALSTSEMSLFETEVKVGALVEYNNDPDCKVIRNRLCGLVWAESAFKKVFGFKFNYRDVFITVADKNYYNSLSGMINELNRNYSSSESGRNDSIIVNNELQRTKKFEEAYTSFITISLLIALGLALFSLLSIISAVMTKLIKRRRIFGFLRAVGLTKKQMFQIILSENMISVVVSFLLGAVCGFVLCSMGESFADSTGALILEGERI